MRLRLPDDADRICPHGFLRSPHERILIETEGLTKVFTVKKSPVHAVTDVSFTAVRGELVAFLGPNGAGKSTTLRMLTTLIRPTSGSARVVGHDIRTDAAGVRARIGYVGQLTSGSSRSGCATNC